MNFNSINIETEIIIALNNDRNVRRFMKKIKGIKAASTQADWDLVKDSVVPVAISMCHAAQALIDDEAERYGEDIG